MRIPPLDPLNTPLSGPQAAQFNTFAASLAPDQTAWLLGYLTASHQLQRGQAAAAGAQGTTDQQLTVLFASQTGNAAKVAKHLSSAATGAGIHAVAVSVVDYKAANLRNERYRTDAGPLVEGLDNYTCRNFSRAYLRHLVMANEILASTLISLHNVHFYLDLVAQARRRIEAGDYAAWHRAWIARYEAGEAGLLTGAGA